MGGTETPCDALVGGFGQVAGRTVLAAAEDFTVLGGSIGAGSMAKRVRICQLALQERVPLVFMLDGAGHRLTDTRGGGRAPNDLLLLADLSGQVPMVCLVLGASAGHGALTSPLSDFTVISEGAAMFTGGPPLVKAALGEEVTKEELGGREGVRRDRRHRAQRREGRRRGDRARAPVSLVLPAAPRRARRRAATAPTRDRASSRSCSGSSRRTTASPTRCTACSSGSSTRATTSRSSRPTARR